jgi:pyrimidine operon attenuation protein/uracil phosphoribosyltransferase
MDVSFYRDDFNQRGLHGNARASHIPFEIEGAHVVIVDDVLYTGRTIRAAMNELFDFGRPARLDLAVLADRGGRELPIAPTFCPHSLSMPAAQMLALERATDGALSFQVMEK